MSNYVEFISQQNAVFRTSLEEDGGEGGGKKSIKISLSEIKQFWKLFDGLSKTLIPVYIHVDFSLRIDNSLMR